MENLSQEEWRALIEKTDNAVILDVRTPQEWEEGCVADAEKLNFLEPALFMEGLEELDKSKTYFIYCRSGNRSGQAGMLMEQNGFNETYNLLGGMLEWDGDLV